MYNRQYLFIHTTQHGLSKRRNHKANNGHYGHFWQEKIESVKKDSWRTTWKPDNETKETDNNSEEIGYYVLYSPYIF